MQRPWGHKHWPHGKRDWPLPPGMRDYGRKPLNDEADSALRSSRCSPTERWLRQQCLRIHPTRHEPSPVCPGTGLFQE